MSEDPRKNILKTKESLLSQKLRGNINLGFSREIEAIVDKCQKQKREKNPRDSFLNLYC